MIKQLVILAGGKGTRLRAVTGDLPKPLAPIGGVAVLEHQVRQAAANGLSEIVFLTSYRSELIEDHFGDGNRFGIRFLYCVDETPLGTAGAVLAALDRLDDHFLLLYGDAMHDVDLRALSAFHLGNNDAAASLLIHPNDHPQDSDLVELDEMGRITAFHGYPHPPGQWNRNLVNAGLYAIQKASLAPFSQEPVPLDFAKGLFPKMVSQGCRLYGYPSREYIKDMGTAKRLQKVNRDFLAGRIAGRNLRLGMPAVFLDRDGTLLQYRRFLSAPGQVELAGGAAAAVAALHEAGYLTVVITNQPVIARGECTVAQLERIHGKMEHLLAIESHAFLDAIYFCPHHPDSGFPGEIPALKIRCQCRKPAPGLIQQAARELNIDLPRSWFIGDSGRDWEAAENAGVRPLLVRGGEISDSELERFPTAQVCPNLKSAAAVIMASQSVLP